VNQRRRITHKLDAGASTNEETTVISSLRIIAGLIFATALGASHVSAQTVLRVVSFDGGWNLPLWAAQRQGLFDANGIVVQLSYTPNSGALVSGLFDGRYDIAMATMDNFIAYQEGQGEATLPVKPDLFAFLGGDNGFLSVVAVPGVKSIADLKGKTLSVDAMSNGLAFVLRELLARGGIAETDVTFVRAGGTSNRYRELLAGKQDATLLRTPFELLARERGLNILAGAESLGAYQGTVGAARQSWAQTHEAALVGFIRAYRAALAWIYDRSNRPIVEALLIANIRDITPALAKQSYDLLLAEHGGLTRDAALDTEGIRTVMTLRGKYATPSKPLSDPTRYVDTRYYDKALEKP
jgi:ABC-type nitrate/sulfonate/bicarbonate transport system substrate-binding protein